MIGNIFWPFCYNKIHEIKSCRVEHCPRVSKKNFQEEV